MSRDDAGLLDAAALAAEYAEDLVVGSIREVHHSVAGRIYGVGDRVAGGTALSHRLHDGISKAVYCGISAGLKGSAWSLKRASRAGVGPDLDDTPHGRFVRAAVNGLIGDRLHAEGSPFAFDAGVRVGGRDVTLDRAGIAGAFPTASPDLVVFVHGLSENEAYWNRVARPRTQERQRRPYRRSYGDRLVEHGWSPVYLRVNSGLPIAHNGAGVAALLDRVVAHWPTDVRRIALIGHSMGGLILRAACAVTTDSESPWTDLVTDVVTLGSPHLGAPLERVVNKGVRYLGLLPEAAPLGRILEYRSVGILDLRHGLAPDIQHLPHARYRLVAATLTRSPRSATAGTVGDYLVPYRSALGHDRHGQEMFPGAETLHVPRADHFDLLNHDHVYAALRAWLQDRSDPPTREETP